MKKRSFIIFLAACIGVAVMALAACTAGTRINTDAGGVAVKGYDTVAYFTDGRPVKGNVEIAYEWNGALWRFASEEHRALFQADPERYAPQYGGY